MRTYLYVSLILILAINMLPVSMADTIYFKDGHSIDCLVHEEKEIWKDIEDPNFLEIEIFGGYVGFWDNGQIERIEKNDRYIPPASDTQAYIKELIEQKRLILPTGIQQGNAIFPGQIDKPISGRITDIKNYAFVRDADLASPVKLEPNQEFRSNQILNTARNSRLKLTVGPVLVGGMAGDTRLRIQRLNHADHILTYEMDFQLEEGQVWLFFQPNVISGDVREKVNLRINDCQLTVENGLLHLQTIPEDQLRISLLRGNLLNVNIRGVASDTSLEQGQTLVIPLSGPRIVSKESAADTLAITWETWDAWKPQKIALSAQTLLGKPVSAPPLGELSAFAEGESHRGVTLAAEPLIDPLVVVLSRYREALNRYKEKVGGYPDPATQGLQILTTPDPETQEADPYGISSLSQVDPWGQPFIYELIPDQEREGAVFVSVRSAGPNGMDEKGLGDDIQ